MITGFLVNLGSGLVLFSTAPVGFVRNVTFLVKLVSVLAAVVVLWRFLRLVFNGDGSPEVAIDTRRARSLFLVSVAFWTLGIAAGRLTAYSAYVISRTVGALLIALVVAVGAAFLARALGRTRGTAPDAPALAASFKGE